MRIVEAATKLIYAASSGIYRYNPRLPAYRVMPTECGKWLRPNRHDASATFD
jgi:hypothetical protein